MNIAIRTPLPQRRFCETREMRLPDKEDVFAVTIGHYHDGSIGEVFVSGAKVGSEVDAVARLRCGLCGKPFSYVPQPTDKCAPGSENQILRRVRGTAHRRGGVF